MSPRERRLLADRDELQTLADSGRIECVGEGPMPERYEVGFRALGLAPGPEGEPILQREHRFDLYLPLDYPRRQPIVAWQTPIFHPEILPPEAEGCICFR